MEMQIPYLLFYEKAVKQKCVKNFTRDCTLQPTDSNNELIFI